MAVAQTASLRQTTAKKKKPLAFVFTLYTDNKEVETSFSGCNMRSLVGLICVIVAATLYLYSLSLYLPAGPRRRLPRADRGEHVEELEQPADTSEEPTRSLLAFSISTYIQYQRGSVV